MDTQKLRMKIGSHEFEAEGDPDTIKQQFEEFKALIADQGKPDKKDSDSQLEELRRDLQPHNPPLTGSVVDRLSKIVKIEGKKPLVLSALPQGPGREGDAALILLWAYKVFRQQDLVGGSAILAGMQTSGYPIIRVDRPLMQKLVDAAPSPLVLRSGKKRGVTYRLTAPGEVRAREVMEETLAHLV